MPFQTNPQQVIMSPSETADGQPTTGPISYTPNDAPSINDMDVNLANANKWYAYFPLEDVLGSQFTNLNLHLTRFSIPQLEQTSNTVSYRGYEKEIAGKVMNPSTKQITLDYIVDADWYNYKALYSWMSGIVGVINPIATDVEEIKNTISPSDYLPMRIYLLGPYKNKILQFKFSNTWIKVFGELALDVNSPDEVVHNFTLAFDEYTIEPC